MYMHCKLSQIEHHAFYTHTKNNSIVNKKTEKEPRVKMSAETKKKTKVIKIVFFFFANQKIARILRLNQLVA
jgi:hypothetical protein